MKRTFKFELQKRIPALAWLMRVTDAEEVRVKHGKAVECHEDFFVAGVWAGEFSKGEIDSAPYVCCSGGCLRQMGGKSLTVITPSHLQETVFSFKKDTELLFSNSLVWLITEGGLELNENYYNYEADLCSVIFGEEKMHRQLPLKGGMSVTMHRNCNIAVDTDFSERDEQEPPPSLCRLSGIHPLCALHS